MLRVSCVSRENNRKTRRGELNVFEENLSACHVFARKQEIFAQLYGRTQFAPTKSKFENSPILRWDKSDF